MTGNSTTHFQTSFRIAPTGTGIGSLDKAFGLVQKKIRDWIIEKESTDQGLLGAWFFNGGQWSNHLRAKTNVTVSCFEGMGSADYPEAWQLRYQEGDSTINQRYWFTDLGIRRTEGELIFSLRVSNSLAHDFVGEPPLLPAASTPKIVRAIVTSNTWKCHSGTLRLGDRAGKLRQGDAMDLWRLICNQHRRSPIILVNGVLGNQFPVDAFNLQQKLLGCAQVFLVPYDSLLAEEMASVFSPDYRCPLNHVRVYLPGVDPSHPYRNNKHRYFTPESIQDLGEVGLTRILVDSLARRYQIPDRDAVLTPSDIAIRKRESRLEAFRKQGKPNEEWIDALEEDNQAINLKLENYKGENQNLGDTISSLEDDVKAKQHELDYLRTQVGRVPSEPQPSLCGDLLQLIISGKEPTPEECIEIVRTSSADRIIILPDAMSSARESSSFNRGRRLLELLVKLGDQYWHALSNGSSGDAQARDIFGNTAFAAQESQTVQESPKLRKYRTFDYEGTPVEMFRHLKIGVQDSIQDTIRVHFHWDASKQKIVIGYCGKHLPLK